MHMLTRREVNHLQLVRLESLQDRIDTPDATHL